MKRPIVIASALLFNAALIEAQDSPEKELTLTLQEVIRLAQQQSPSALAARHSLHAAQWNYRYYKADYLPSVTLTSTPDYTRSINKVTLSDGTQSYVEQNRLTTDLQLAIKQNVTFTGGYFTLTSSAERLDLFGEESNSTFYNTAPIYLGYSQSLFGYNTLKWNRRIEPIVYREACKQYNETMELVASQACNYFSSLATAQTNLEIARFNLASADTLNRYAKGRYDIGTITENDMLQLEINKLNAEEEQISAQMSVDDQMQTLRTYLNLQDDVNLHVVIDDSIPQFIVPIDEAMAYAYQNNPDPETFQRQRLQSESNLAYAKANAGLKADIYLQFGLTQTGNTLRDAYHDPINSQYASISLSLPILDWGKGKGRVKVARSNRDLTHIQVEQNERNFEQNVQRIVRQFNIQGNHMTIAAKTATTAERRFEVARRLYLMGKSTVLDLNAAISEKDAARRNHISTLKTFWSLYYTLRSLTGYDFERGEKISYKLAPSYTSEQ